MPKLRRGEGGTGYQTKVLHDDQTVIYEITPEGVAYLKDRGCEAEGSFDLSDLYYLIDQGWASTTAQAPGGTSKPKPRKPEPDPLAGSGRGSQPAAIADAAALFLDDPPTRDRNRNRGHQDPPKVKATPVASAPEDLGGGYELLGDDLDDSRTAPIVPLPVPEPARPRSSPIMDDEEEEPKKSRSSRSRTLDSYVDDPWTRGAEWGPDLIRLGVLTLLTLVLAYFASASFGIGMGLLVMLLGGLTLIAFSYPIVITLERPTRITPEQAVRDYFAAISHHFPHYRRMWLLLSTPGRSTPEYQSFSEFRKYWKEVESRIRERSQGSKFTPLSFRVEAFKADKSAGRDDVEASLTIEVYLRGQTDGEPLHSVRLKSSLVRGPDRMWYLDDGRLPD